MLHHNHSPKNIQRKKHKASPRKFAAHNLSTLQSPHWTLFHLFYNTYPVLAFSVFTLKLLENGNDVILVLAFSICTQQKQEIINKQKMFIYPINLCSMTIKWQTLYQILKIDQKIKRVYLAKGTAAREMHIQVATFINCAPPKQRRGYIFSKSSHPGSQLGLFYVNELSKLCCSDWSVQMQVRTRGLSPSFLWQKQETGVFLHQLTHRA